MDSIKSSVFRPTETGEDTHPHACTDGLVFLTYTAFDLEIGDEVEKIEAIPCRRCADEARIGNRVGVFFGVSWPSTMRRMKWKA
jgi:hypothetical protein